MQERQLIRYNGLGHGQISRDFLLSINDQGRILRAHTLLCHPGMQMILWQQREKRAEKVFFKIYKPHIELEFHLQGAARHNFFDKNDISFPGLQPGHWAFNTVEKCEGQIEYLPSEPVLCLSIILEPKTLGQNAWHTSRLLRPVLESSRSCDRRNPTFNYGLMNPAMFAAVGQMLDCPYTGPVRELFLKAKVMELIALQMAQAAYEKEAKKPWRLGEDELMAVRAAREALLTDLNNTPRLKDLAKEVGLNRNKLNQGFRQLYGATAFEILRAERLKKAKIFLQNSQMSLAEIAQAAGYCAQSHFTSAFTAQFGVPPGQFRKKTHPVDSADISH